MPKKSTPPKKISKLTSKKNLWKIVLVSAAILLVTSAVVAKKLMVGQQAGIFEVKTGMPPIPTSSPVAAACMSKIASYTATGACALQGFKSITYVCTNGNRVEKLGGQSCLDLVTTLQEAQKNCGVVCPSPTPALKPSPSPTNTPPKPTLTPTPTPRWRLPIPRPSSFNKKF